MNHAATSEELQKRTKGYAASVIECIEKDQGNRDDIFRGS